MFTKTLILSLVSTILAYPDSKAISQAQAQTTVSTPLGILQGSILATRLGKPIYTFRGVRYAKAPIEELRFQPAVATEKWEGTKNATIDGPACIQPGNSFTSEDCLLLNVYTTKLPKGSENEKRPVIVYFHAGSFETGSSNSGLLSPKYLLDHDVVLVTPNYRLGILGFLSLADKEAPGNLGLKDQVLALKWVKDNIVAFGGNPDCVTIAGSGSGGFSVTLHLVSPLSKGLFHKAIAMSGSSFGHWTLPLSQFDLAKKQAKLLGCSDDTSSNIIKCLKSKSSNEIAESEVKLKEFGTKNPEVVWLPVLEQEYGQERFLTELPIELALDNQINQVPVLTGLTTDEEVDHAFEVISNPKLLQELDQSFERVAPIAFMYLRNTENSKSTSKDLRKFYFEDKPIDNTSVAALAQLYADALVGFGVNRLVEVLADKSNESVYYYRFNYKGRHSNFYLPDSNNTVPYGVAQSDDLIYLLPSPNKFVDYKQEDPETNTIEKLTKMWYNFVSTGKPIPEQSEQLDNVKWEPFTTKTEKYLDIGNKLMLHEKLNEKRYAVWEKLFPLSKYQAGKKKHQG